MGKYIRGYGDGFRAGWEAAKDAQGPAVVSMWPGSSIGWELAVTDSAEAPQKTEGSPPLPPCAGHKCGCTDGLSHSDECRLEHDASYMGAYLAWPGDARHALMALGALVVNQAHAEGEGFSAIPAMMVAELAMACNV